MPPELEMLKQNDMIDEDDEDTLSDLYERMPKIDDRLANQFSSRRSRDRSHSLPAVHGQFVLVNRGWTPPKTIVEEGDEAVG